MNSGDEVTNEYQDPKLHSMYRCTLYTNRKWNWDHMKIETEIETETETGSDTESEIESEI